MSVDTVTFTGATGERVTLAKLGKKAAGRRLDGITWDGFPGAAL